VRAFDLAEPARRLAGEKQTIQNWIAESAAEMQAARLMTLQAAWVMDTQGATAARKEIAMIKYFGAKVLLDVIDRAIQVHGSLGFSTDMPLEHMYRASRAARIYDGPDEVHKVTVARQMLKQYQPAPGPWPTSTCRPANKPRSRSSPNSSTPLPSTANRERANAAGLQTPTVEQTRLAEGAPVRRLLRGCVGRCGDGRDRFDAEHSLQRTRHRNWGVGDGRVGMATRSVEKSSAVFKLPTSELASRLVRARARIATR